ncbi:acylneuraminate cytidylyltransferase family protein [Candidatus Woesearchaeota archaeon]|jgi:CMP-N,N'-diacetyllegionaminic acid synthase|nr:acylneuraminate cytidylyltransferase family protein [Candidatus Woesearchaeota archaeon]MBT3538435.1 acylneuraminate cytidylyltransferase family protein [Candidatus Woesearchaeota archaeon]MBT4696998.1 acylneuraminate cytidylyltransferase family protein [Candidatus Woesearchaeota archaeon]MBT7106109.1 acylneuraminate cytidylyltransferase family protein [Candidatus Woesearchaeota archaeon]MBT7930993.1 acylneuraminate cytidylyltransferase family protein [Candidatus Woesearchaeota archaeon]
MYNGKKIIAIIPARGGSKRIPKKNVKLLCGEPLISYTIKCALCSKYIDKTYVSSDSEDVLNISKHFEVGIIKRPPEYATDKAKSIDVMKHVLSYIQTEENNNPDIVILLQPTSPLRTSEKVDDAIKIFVDNGADRVLSVTKRHIGTEWILKKDQNQLKFKFENNFDKIRSQDQDETYEINGSIHLFSRDVILNSKNYGWGDKVFPICIGKLEAVDIDDMDDFLIAEALMKRNKRS